MEKGNNRIGAVWEIAMLVVTASASAFAVWLYDGSLSEILRMFFVSAMACGCTVFAMENEPLRVDLSRNASKGPFVMVYFLFFACALVFPLLPEVTWPYPALFIGLALLGGKTAGICSGVTLLTITSFLRPGFGMELFSLYLISGLLGVLLFSGATEAFRMLYPVFVLTAAHFLCMCISAVLMKPERFRLSMLLEPAAGTFLSLAVLALVWSYGRRVLFGSGKGSAELNDPVSPLLRQLMECSEEEYFHSIHTAYLCDRIARGIGLDADAVRMAGYYHRIGILHGIRSWENTRLIMKEHQFPDTVCRLLGDYLQGGDGIVSKEAAVLLFADTMISSLRYLFSENSEAVVDYPELTKVVSDKILASGELRNSRISLWELEEIKRILVEEEKYYEFLR